MWVMTSFGVLMPGLRPEGKIPEGDNRTLQVRARRKKDLEILKSKYMGDELGDPIALPYTDYEWRAYCTPEAWGRALAKIGSSIDYVKFKETAESKFHDKELHDLYLSIWSTIFHHLSEPEHQTSYWSSGTGTGGYGLTGAVGKYGSTYGGTGNFSGGRVNSKKKKAKNRQAGQSRYTHDQEPTSFLGKQPWWADVDEEDPYRNERDHLGMDGYGEFIERAEAMNALRVPGEQDNFESLLSQFEDLDVEKPVFKSANEIDHTYCDHGISKSAKKRCRSRWRRYARSRVSQALTTTIG
jgi:hypothetical protein